jgi:transcriptional regulator with XRE-family HTH domain
VTNQEIMIEIGRRLGERRRELGLSLSGLAQRCGVSLQQVHKYERAQSVVSAPMLFHLSRCMDVPITFFFDGVEGAHEKPPTRG